jgi:hypothetical protein
MIFKSLLMSLILLGCAGALTFEDLKVSFLSLRLKNENGFVTKADELKIKYLKALQNLQKSFQDQGSLDEALSVDQETKNLKLKGWPLPPLSAGGPASLEAARKIYVRQYLSHKKDVAKNMIEASEKMQQLLEKKIIELTKEGDLATAQKAKAYLAEIKVDVQINEYKALLKRVSDRGRSPAALRVRRFGDEVEVLVRFDTGGKISMDSPISNTIEITGGRKERGNTEAISLGEFLGAPKFNSFPAIVFDHTFEGGKDIPFQAIDIEVTPIEFDDKKGISLTVSTVAANPMINLAKGKIPSVANSCKYRVSYEYLVPKSNKTVGALFIQQGHGFPIEDRVFRKNGSWHQAEITTFSKSENDFLRIFLSGPAGTQLAKTQNESIWLHSLQIEILSFAAFICEEFGESGESKIVYEDAQKQPLFAKNGELIAPDKN